MLSILVDRFCWDVVVFLLRMLGFLVVRLSGEDCLVVMLFVVFSFGFSSILEGPGVGVFGREYGFRRLVLVESHIGEVGLF